MKKNSTIFALSTPPGKAAIAIIRLSGKHSYKCIKKISANMPKNPNTSTFNEIKTKEGKVIDQTITTFFKAPKSFTGEDMVEISFHGGPAVIKKIINMLSKKNNLRLASPGEFTRRAFENNKLDLTQVEAISDIVNAETEMQRKQAISHLSGHFFKTTRDIFENLKKILANIEVVIDFSEEDLPENMIEDIKEQIENNIIKINKILEGKSSGFSVRSGFLIAILGKTNSGKSSFINNVAGKDVAIVTNKPGTTRDLIEIFLDLDGYPVRLVDTAGIRDSSDLVEKIGVNKAIAISKESDINIVFIEKKKDILDFENIKNAIFVRSKHDINGGNFDENSFFNISSKNSYGINDFLKKITEKLQEKTPTENIAISRERHAKCLFDTVYHLKRSREEKNIDIFSEDIRQSLKSISSLFGNVDIEEILDIIFSDFCIGK